MHGETLILVVVTFTLKDGLFTPFFRACMGAVLMLICLCWLQSVQPTTASADKVRKRVRRMDGCTTNCSDEAAEISSFLHSRLLSCTAWAKTSAVQLRAFYLLGTWPRRRPHQRSNCKNVLRGHICSSKFHASGKQVHGVQTAVKKCIECHVKNNESLVYIIGRYTQFIKMEFDIRGASIPNNKII